MEHTTKYTNGQVLAIKKNERKMSLLEAASDADTQVTRMKAEGYSEDGIAIMEAHRDRLRAKAEQP